MSDEGPKTHAYMTIDEVVRIVDYGYVFPQGVTDGNGKEIRRAGGMTKRELFAAIIYASRWGGLNYDDAVIQAENLLAALEKPRA